MSQYNRTVRTIGEADFRKLRQAKVLLFGIGGVGSYTGEALVRAGIGQLTIVDRDVVDVTNINRQLIALHSTIGQDKVLAAAKRYADIDPTVTIVPIKGDVTPDNMDVFQIGDFDYVIDAVDTVSAKLAIIKTCHQKHIPVITCMGTGNKTNAAGFEVTTVEKTSVCPLARVMRRELKTAGITGIKTVYSKESPIVRTDPPGSLSFVPGTAGLIIAGEVVRDLLSK